MARARTVFVCQACGHRAPRWMGRCPECEEWETLVEEREEPAGGSGRATAPRGSAKPVRMQELRAGDEPRRETGIGELDRVLGGGLVPGSVVLMGGDPGIGKSTLALQAAARLARAGRKVLYVSGEESGEQIRMRSERLGVADEELWVLCDTSAERIVQEAAAAKADLVVVDSIQTVSTDTLASAPGSVGQVRESAARLVQLAKSGGPACLLVGHVTKEGSIAGPRVLEHLVDTVLYFEGDRGHPFRVLRAVKNRFGSTNEIGVFEMRETGLEPVENPSALFLAERPEGVAGSVVTATIEGTRPILVEIQALVTPSTFGTPRRTTLGVDGNRVALLVAVLERKIGLQLTGQDVFVNVAGGFRIGEPSADLAIVVAIASSFLDRPIDARTLIFGEVGLAGEIRAVSQSETRVREAVKMGFRRCLLPAASLRTEGAEGVEGVRSLDGVWERIFAA